METSHQTINNLLNRVSKDVKATNNKATNFQNIDIEKQKEAIKERIENYKNIIHDLQLKLDELNDKSKNL